MSKSHMSQILGGRVAGAYFSAQVGGEDDPDLEAEQSNGERLPSGLSPLVEHDSDHVFCHNRI